MFYLACKNVLQATVRRQTNYAQQMAAIQERDRALDKARTQQTKELERERHQKINIEMEEHAEQLRWMKRMQQEKKEREMEEALFSVRFLLIRICFFKFIDIMMLSRSYFCRCW